MNINALLIKHPQLAGAVSVLIESCKAHSDKEALKRWDELRKQPIKLLTGPTQRCVTKIEFGPSPSDFKVILDDGSELFGVTRATVETEWEKFSTFRLDGYVLAGIDPRESDPASCTSEVH